MQCLCCHRVTLCTVGYFSKRGSPQNRPSFLCSSERAVCQRLCRWTKPMHAPLLLFHYCLRCYYKQYHLLCHQAPVLFSVLCMMPKLNASLLSLFPFLWYWVEIKKNYNPATMLVLIQTYSAFSLPAFLVPHSVQTLTPASPLLRAPVKVLLCAGVSICGHWIWLEPIYHDSPLAFSCLSHAAMQFL